MTSRALADRAGEQLAVLAKDVGLEVSADAVEQRVNVAAWARQEVMRDIVVGDIDKRISRFLTSIRATYGGYLELLVTDVTGRVVAATDPARVATMLEPPVPTALRAGARWHPVREAAHGRLVLELAEPVADPDEPGSRIGELVAHYDWTRVSDLTARMRRGLVDLGLTVDFMIVDDDMRILGGAWQAAPSRLDATLPALGWDAAEALVSRGRAGFVLESGADAVVGYAPAPRAELAWGMLALQPRGEALAPAYHMRRRMAVFLGAGLVLALAVGALLAERMIRPLRTLTAATRRLAATGELAEPIGIRSSDEIGELGAAFDTAAADLRRARDDLVAASKLAFVGELAAGMAHEIRTPLGILRSSAQMLRRADAAGAASRQELVDMIVGEVDRLDRVVSGLTELARPRTLVVQPTPVRELLARAVDFVEGQAAEKGVRLERAFGEGPCVAHCDPDEIYQVALNLIVNALQMTPAGGRVAVRTFAAADHVVGFEIEDTGPGITPERRARIFTPFVSFREGGTGLGLATAQRIVIAHGGTIAVRSDGEHGAVFRVELPAFGEAAA
jgi:two-component system sensor histidine kinase HydH